MFNDNKNQLSLIKEVILFLNPKKVTIGSNFKIIDEKYFSSLSVHVRELELNDMPSLEMSRILCSVVPIEKLSISFLGDYSQILYELSHFTAVVK